MANNECVVCGGCVKSGPYDRKYCSDYCIRLMRSKVKKIKQRKYTKEYYSRPEVKERQREYYSRPEVKEKQLKYIVKYNTERRKTDQVFALRTRVSNLVRNHVAKRGFSKSNTIVKLLGYSIQELKEHLESQFTDGMSWDNRNEWHIDHIRPESSFDYDSTDHPDFKKCWALNNLQPLWAKDNLSKSDKWDGVVNA